jgi:hypothetical protein
VKRTAIVVAAGLLVPLPARAETLNLYDWMAVAPTVVAGRVKVDDQRYVQVEVTHGFRGDLLSGQVVAVDQRKANRERDTVRPALKLEEGRDYVLLLKRAAPKKDEPPPYEIVRGTEGAREIPAEGGVLWIEAAERFARVQDRKDERVLWRSLTEMLEDPNPILLETSLDMFLKFRRGQSDLLPSVRPLLEHPRADFREKSLLLIGQVLERTGGAPAEQDAGLLSEMIGRARRDESVPVRVAATRALGSVSLSGRDEILREIARDDPEQLVRYEAEVILFASGSKGRPKPRSD